MQKPQHEGCGFAFCHRSDRRYMYILDPYPYMVKRLPYPPQKPNHVRDVRIQIYPKRLYPTHNGLPIDLGRKRFFFESFLDRTRGRVVKPL
jgi:hypothetical protein